MVTQDGEAYPSASRNELPADRDQTLIDRFKRLPRAVPITATIAVVGATPMVPLGPEGATGGGDGD